MTCLLLSLGAAVGCQALVDLDYGFAAPDAGPPRSSGTGGSGGSGGADQMTPPADAPDGDMTDLPPPSGEADCAQGNSAACAPPPVVLHGSVVHFDTGEPFAGVRLGVGSVLSSATGEFEYPVATPDSFVDLTLTQPEAGGGILGYRRTQLRIDDPRTASEHNLRLPSVVHAWLVEVAIACQVIDAAAPQLEVDDYFNQRSTLLAQVPNTPDITSDQITVTMTRGTGQPWVNSHESPLDTMGPPAHVCFLEQDALRNLVGGTRAASTELGQFVMFRVRNVDGGGSGLAQVNVTGHGSASVSFSGAGETGVARLGAGWEL